MSITSAISSPEGARWEAWDRDRLQRLVERLPDHARFCVSSSATGMVSILRVWGSRSVHLTFEDRPGYPRAVFVTKLSGSGRDRTRTIEWLSGGLRAWVDQLEIDRDLLLEALFAVCDVRESQTRERTLEP